MLIPNVNIDFRQDEKWITVNGTHVKVEGNGTSKPGDYDDLTGPFKNKKNSDDYQDGEEEEEEQEPVEKQ